MFHQTNVSTRVTEYMMGFGFLHFFSLLHFQLQTQQVLQFSCSEMSIQAVGELRVPLCFTGEARTTSILAFLLARKIQIALIELPVAGARKSEPKAGEI